jgi:ferredoxin-thioredoxin reductase catalytic subunit
MTGVTIEAVKARAQADAQTYGYYLTPDAELLQAFLEGLRANEERYGYPSCPCRLASGIFEYDRDIICPCDYRDPDVIEFGACYCRLYVTKQVYENRQLPTVPERRPLEKQAKAYEVSAERQTQEAIIPKEVSAVEAKTTLASKQKLWYCKQCGYVVFRDDPPYVCPICKAKKELFVELKTRVDFSG